METCKGMMVVSQSLWSPESCGALSFQHLKAMGGWIRGSKPVGLRVRGRAFLRVKATDLTTSILAAQGHFPFLLGSGLLCFHGWF
jgi:hypothetical protein